MAEPNLEQLKQKYQAVLNVIQQSGSRLQNVHIENGKLLIRAEAPSQEAKNRIWDQIKIVDASYPDLTADITVAGGQTQAAGAATGGGQSTRTYVVQPGDSLSKVARQFYGNPNDYMRIFNANRDRIKDPNRIQPGQELVIP